MKVTHPLRFKTSFAEFIDLGYNTFKTVCSFSASTNHLEGSDLLFHAALEDQTPDFVILDIKRP